jgi:hypothetical protein
LLNRCRALKSYPGFESLPHRHPPALALARRTQASYGEMAHGHDEIPTQRDGGRIPASPPRDAARTLDQYAAGKVGDSEGVHSTRSHLNDNKTDPLIPVLPGSASAHRRERSSTSRVRPQSADGSCLLRSPGRLRIPMLTLGTTAVAFAGTALAAARIPPHRPARVDPVTSLRAD